MKHGEFCSCGDCAPTHEELVLDAIVQVPKLKRGEEFTTNLEHPALVVVKQLWDKVNQLELENTKINSKATKAYPILASKGEPRTYVPWGLVEQYSQVLYQNHGQSVQRLADRGGISIHEMAAAIQNLPRFKATNHEALAVVEKTVKAYTGSRVIELEKQLSELKEQLAQFREYVAKFVENLVQVGTVENGSEGVINPDNIVISRSDIAAMIRTLPLPTPES